MNDGSKSGFWSKARPDASLGWLMGMAAADLLAIALSDAAGALARSASGAAGRMLWIASDLALLAAVVVAVALLPVIGHGVFGAGWSGGPLGKASSRAAPAGLRVAGVLTVVSVICLLAGLALPG